jgi:hypothetical protein
MEIDNISIAKVFLTLKYVAIAGFLVNIGPIVYWFMTIDLPPGGRLIDMVPINQYVTTALQAGLWGFTVTGCWWWQYQLCKLNDIELMKIKS